MSRRPSGKQTPAEAAQLARARQHIDYAANHARLRAWHVRMGHMLKDATPQELADIAKARAAGVKDTRRRPLKLTRAEEAAILQARAAQAGD